MDDWSWGGWLVMTATMVVFWALVAWVVVVAIRASRPSTQDTPDPERILAERLAAGEIDEDEYHRRLDALRRHHCNRVQARKSRGRCLRLVVRSTAEPPLRVSLARVLHRLLNYSAGVVAVVAGVERVGGLDTLARVGTALADGTRRRILVRLLDGPAYPAELADLLGTGRANVSNHLACLRGCGLVIAEREGRFVRYQVAHPDLAGALRLLAGVPLATEPGHADLDGRR